MKMPWKNVVCICAVFLIFALVLGYFLNSTSGTYVEGTVDTEDLIIIDAKVEKISFYENYIWMNIEYMEKLAECIVVIRSSKIMMKCL